MEEDGGGVVGGCEGEEFILLRLTGEVTTLVTRRSKKAPATMKTATAPSRRDPQRDKAIEARTRYILLLLAS
jgi:hypothetical protein